MDHGAASHTRRAGVLEEDTAIDGKGRDCEIDSMNDDVWV